MSVSPLALEQVAAEKPLFWMVVATGERIAAALALCLISPMLLAVGLGIVILSGRSPLVAHRRIGYRGQELWVLKLRTMWDTCNHGSVPVSFVECLAEKPVPEYKSRKDSRVTSRFAAFCRKYSIDEAPQLWQVVRGEMALVGPRPLTIDEHSKYYGRFGVQLLCMKPGLTGLWQIRGRNRLTYRARRKLDLFMIRKWSPRLYLMILGATFPRVLSGKDAY